MSNNYKIKDNSNDKKYFTIIPNCVLNHSNAIDQALYLQMKRVAGDSGKCFMTVETLCKKLGVGARTIRKSIKYLIDNGWIKFIGTTPGKTRPIKTYMVNDIWEQNTEFYKNKKIRVKRTISKDTGRKAKDTGQMTRKIRVEKGGILITNIKNNIKKKYSSLKDIGKEEIKAVAEDYQVPISFVESSHEDLVNYCNAHGRRYKNYLAALRNFVKKDAKVNGIKRQPKPETSNLPNLTPLERAKAQKKLDKIRSNLSGRLTL